MRIQLALILLVGVVACAVALYFTYEPKPRVTQASPWVPSPERIEYDAFRAQMFNLMLRSKPENQTAENGPAIAAMGLELMNALRNHQPHTAVTRGRESVQAIRSIYGDQSFVTRLVVVQSLEDRRWNHRQEYKLEVLLPMLDEAYELAEAQGTPHPDDQLLGRMDLFYGDEIDVRLALCRWFRNFAYRTEYHVGERIKRGALDEAAERLEYARIVLDHPWYGSLCESSRDGKTERTMKVFADAEAALDAARAEEGD